MCLCICVLARKAKEREAKEREAKEREAKEREAKEREGSLDETYHTLVHTTC